MVLATFAQTKVDRLPGRYPASQKIAKTMLFDKGVKAFPSFGFLASTNLR
jgi:hypothetical protein